MMLFNKTVRIVCVFILLFNLFTVSGQVTSFYPEKPEWNDEVFVKYDAGDSKALLKGNEVVYLRISMNFQNGDSKVIVLKTDRKGNVYQCSFKVPESLTSAKAVFFTLTREDNKNSLIIKVYGNGKPVENANIDAMPYFEPNSDSLFQKEIKNYPENYKAYGIYFTKIIPPPYSDELNEALNKYLPFLEDLYNKNPNNQGVIYSLCIGYAKNKEISKSRSLLYKLIDDFPGSPLTNNALNIYGYESFKAGNNPAVDKEIISLLSDKFKLNPEYPVCKQNIYLLEKDSTLNRNLFIEALESLVKDDSLDYSSKIKLAEYYLNNEEYDKAEVLIEKTINFLLHSGMKYKWNARNSYLKKELARAYEVRARVREKKLDYVNAYSSINSAIELLKDDQNGNVVFEYKRFRANLYLKFDNFAMAEEEYAVLYLTEDKEAKSGLLNIYNITHSDTTGFSVYLNSLEKRFADKIKYKKAPGFKIKDRQGNEYVSSKMTDKVIVLNFWGIGCGPCVVEIPELNKLVDKYKNSNVVFIALTYDKDDVLDKFLEKHRFDYNIVNTAWYLAKKFNVSGIPRHFVVKNGEIVKSVLGAKPDIVNQLSKAIDKALTEG